MQKNKKIIIVTMIIFLILIVPMMVSRFIYNNYNRLNLKTYQNGTFVKPMLDLDKTGFYPMIVEKLEIKNHKTWVMLTRADRCKPYDELNHDIVKLQNIMDLMGRRYDQVRAVVLYSDGCGVSAKIKQRLAQFHEIRLLQLNAQAFKNYFPTATVKSESLYLIDPNGYLMMSYPNDYAPQQVYPDLKKLLRSS